MLTPLEQLKLHDLKRRYPYVRTVLDALQSAAQYEEVHEQMCPAIPEWLQHKMAENQLLHMAKLLRKIEAPYFYVINPMTFNGAST